MGHVPAEPRTRQPGLHTDGPAYDDFLDPAPEWEQYDLEAKHGSFRGYLRSHEDFDATVKDVRKQFKFMGDMGTYLFLYVVGEEVASYEEWHTSRAG